MMLRRRIWGLAIVMAVVALGVGGILVSFLYHAHLEGERDRLTETAQSQARLIESVAAYDLVQLSGHPPAQAFFETLGQVRVAHEQFEGFGTTGEFTLARLDGDQIVFLLSHRYLDLEDPAPIPVSSTLAEPQRRALSGESGTLIGLDYRGQMVLAAYEPVAVHGQTLGIVAKIDLSEVRRPFILAVLWGGAGGFLLILLGVLVFHRIGQPLLRNLAESELLFRRIFDSADDGLLLADTATKRFSMANQAFCAMVDRTEAELRDLGVMDIHPENALPEVMDQFEKQARGEQLLAEAIPVLRKDGSIFLADISSFHISMSGKEYLLGAFRDITERKRLEGELLDSRDRLRSLTAYLGEVREEERRLLARELHDEVGQDLTAMRMDLRRIQQGSLDGQGTFAEQLNSMSEILDGSIDIVNRLSHELRSPVLEFLGIEAAIEAHAREIQERSRLDIVLGLHLGEIERSHKRDTALLRIFEEAMSNVTRHAQASHAEVDMRVLGDAIVLELRDDGIGITEEQLQDGRSFGLIGMREQAVLLAGNVEIRRNPGGGTWVTVVIPVGPATPADRSSE